MEFALCLPPEDAAALPRLPLLDKAGRGRAQSVRLIWHDSPGGELAAQGLALVQERGNWRLERIVYGGTEAWAPGAAPPVLEQTAGPDAMTHALPAPLAPVAAFEARRTTYTATSEAGVVTLALLRGAVRTLTREHATCWLQLSGDPRPVRTVALAIAAALPASVPQRSLSAEALSLSHPAPAAARDLELPDVPPHATPGWAFGAMLAHMAAVILWLAPHATDGPDRLEGVHQMRVSVRRVRSAIAVFRRAIDVPELAAVNSGLKALGKQLAPSRDWDVFITDTAPAVAAALPDDKRLTALVAAAERIRRECHTALRAFLRGSEFRRTAIELAWLAAARPWETEAPAEVREAPTPLTAFADHVLSRRLRKLLDVEDLATLDPPALHAVRLRTKRTRYAAELFAPLYPAKPARRLIRRLATLQDRLGHLNDTATAAALLATLGAPAGRHAYAAGLVLGFAAARADALRPRALRSWDKLRHTTPFWE